MYRLPLAVWVATTMWSAATGTCLGDDEAKSTPFSYSGRLSSLKQESEFLGAGWGGPTGLVIDDVNDLSSLSGENRKAAESLVKLLQAQGVAAAADFTYQKQGDKAVPSMVTLRVFVYPSTESAQQWWTKKYEFRGADTYYKKVEGIGDRAVDLKLPADVQLPKRIVMAGNVLVTCHSYPSGDVHLKVLDRYLDKIGITSSKKTDTPPP